MSPLLPPKQLGSACRLVADVVRAMHPTNMPHMSCEKLSGENFHLKTGSTGKKGSNQSVGAACKVLAPGARYHGSPANPAGSGIKLCCSPEAVEPQPIGPAEDAWGVPPSSVAAEDTSESDAPSAFTELGQHSLQTWVYSVVAGFSPNSFASLKALWRPIQQPLAPALCNLKIHP